MVVITLISNILIVSQLAIAMPSTSLLNARQKNAAFPIPPVPGACQSQCQSMSSITAQCANQFGNNPYICLCNDESGRAFQQCVNCGYQVAGDNQQTRNQITSTLQGLNDVCQQNGRPFNPRIIVGGNFGNLDNNVNGNNGNGNGNGNTQGSGNGSGIAGASNGGSNPTSSNSGTSTSSINSNGSSDDSIGGNNNDSGSNGSFGGSSSNNNGGSGDGSSSDFDGSSGECRCPNTRRDNSAASLISHPFVSVFGFLFTGFAATTSLL